MKVRLNGYDYALNGRPVRDGETLWLPGSEMLSLFYFSNIDETDSYICAWYMDDQYEMHQCNFAVGNNIYSPATESEVWIETEALPYS